MPESQPSYQKPTTGTDGSLYYDRGAISNHNSLNSTWVNAIAFVAFFASGFAALVYQIAWFRMTATVLGNTVYASAAVLAAFMAGLAIGSRVFGRIAPRLGSPMFVYSFQEILIGVWAIATPWMMTHLYVLFVPIAHAMPDTPAAGTAIRFLLALLPMLLPTALMGGTLPVL